MIYIATWGDPLGWSTDAKYVCEDSKVTEGFSGIFCYEKFDRVIIITLDSILTPIGKDKPKNTKAYNCIKQINVSEIKDYDTWKTKTEEYIKCIISNYIPDVIVLPAIGKYGDFTYGKYKNTWIRPEHLKIILAYELYKKLKEIRENEEVILDTTHGVNYVGALTLLTLQKLSTLLKFRLTVINFIPTVMFKEYSFTEVYRIKPSVFDYDSIDEKNIGKDRVKKAIILSLKRNSVLMLAYLCDSVSLSGYEFKPVIEGNEIKLVNDLNVKKEDEAWADIISDYLCKKVRSKGEKKRYLSSLRDLAKEIYGNSAFAVITDKELNDLWSIARNNLGFNEEKLYKDIRMKDQNSEDTETKKEKEEKDVTIRNFIAHAGLLKDIVKVKKVSDKELEISYDANSENIKTLSEILDVELNELLNRN
ncbi:TM1812 family CRISPR-associated protein [Sulfolobus tengchongensis]|uniref:TM1812 family CRISPR-associated protein n=1 Tax=Sulfolobus tengchongensis TaxID=207809 RepID=A0AAX4KYF1_9CREN